MKLLVKMKNGGIVNIISDKNYTNGCPTCDYGSCYVNYYDIKLTTINIHIEVSKMFYYLLSEGDMMVTILPNLDKISQMEELEFAKWLKTNLEQIVNKYKTLDAELLKFAVSSPIEI